MRIIRYAAVLAAALLCGCASLHQAHRPRATIRYGATLGGEVGNYPTAQPLSGSERMLSDQAGITVDILPSQIATYLGQLNLTLPGQSGQSGCLTTNGATASWNAGCGGVPASPLYGIAYNNAGAWGSLLPGSTGTWCFSWTSLSAPPTLVTCSGGGSSAFGSLTSGTNTIAAMTVGSGASFTFTGTGVVDVNEVNHATIPLSATCAGTNASGQFIPATNCVTTTGSPASGNIAAFSGPATVTTATSAQIATALSSTPQAITVASCTGCGGSGSPGGSSLSVQYNNAGVLGGISSPTAGAGYYALRADPTSTTAVAATFDQVGMKPRSISGSTATDTALFSDVLGTVLHDKAASAAVTETLPTPTSLGNTYFAYIYCNDSAQTDTITPTTWTIALNGGAAGASVSVLAGQCATVTVDPFNASQWDAFTYGATTGGSGAASNLQTFLGTSGTWTKPTGSYSNVKVLCIAGGSGGGSGAVEPSGTAVTGGAGAGGNPLMDEIFPYSTVPSSVTVTIGAAGTGGAAVTATGVGNTGNQGGNTTFGSLLTAYPGAPGGGGQNAAASVGGGTGGMAGAASGISAGLVCGANGVTGATGTQASCAEGGASGGGDAATGTNGSNGGTSALGSSGAGAGSGISTAPAASVGGKGGGINGVAATSNGASCTTAGPAGTAPSGQAGGQGGGGGGSCTTGNGAAGGNGAGYGAPGAGGAAAIGTFSSGAGGNGTAGACWVLTW